MNRLLLSVVMLLQLAVAALAVGWDPQPVGPASRLPEPPFVRRWTARIGDDAAVAGVTSGTVYAYGDDGVLAIDLRTGALRWRCLVGQKVSAAIVSGGELIAVTSPDSTGTLNAVDLATRSVLWSRPAEDDSGPLVADRRRVYVLNSAARLTAYDRRTGARSWTTDLSRGRRVHSPLREIAYTDGGIYVSVELGRPGDAGADFGIAPANGRILWSRPDEFPGMYRPLVIGHDVVTLNNGMVRIAVRNGRVRWRRSETDGLMARIGNVIVDTQDGNLVGRSARNGASLWRHTIGESGLYTYTQPLSDDHRAAWVWYDGVYCVTDSGRQLWRASEPYTGAPVYADAQCALTVDDDRVLAYVHGKRPSLPSGPLARRALASRLAAKFERIDDGERADLEHLGNDAFLPLLQRYVFWAQAMASSPAARTRSPDLLRASLTVLQTTFRRQNTAAVIDAIAAIRPAAAIVAKIDPAPEMEADEELIRLLDEKGDPDIFIPWCLQTLREEAHQDDVAAVDAVAQSSRPGAVAFLIAALRDPQARYLWRNQAFLHLAGIGGAAGVEAVRAARAARGPRRPWYDRLDLDRIEADHEADLGVKTDAAGRTWMLFQSDILGDSTDLFVVQKLGPKQWGRPLFTGDLWKSRLYDKPSSSGDGMVIAGPLRSDWIQVLPDDASIRQDSDGDGLTDLVERRLGTDPRNPDTDGDGLSDAVDPCPTVAPRPLSDTEKIIAACMEARFFGDDRRLPPAILSVPGVRPFELYGYPSILLWDTPGHRLPISEAYGSGMDVLRLGGPGDRRHKGNPLIVFSPDRRTVHAVISRIGGPMNGDGFKMTLRKIGDDWFVVDMQSAWIS